MANDNEKALHLINLSDGQVKVATHAVDEHPKTGETAIEVGICAGVRNHTIFQAPRGLMPPASTISRENLEAFSRDREVIMTDGTRKNLYDLLNEQGIFIEESSDN